MLEYLWVQSVKNCAEADIGCRLIGQIPKPGWRWAGRHPSAWAHIQFASVWPPAASASLAGFGKAHCKHHQHALERLAALGAEQLPGDQASIGRLPQRMPERPTLRHQAEI